MKNILEIVRATILEHGMVDADQRVLVACSGGSDSVSLLHVLLQLGFDLAVAHFNHQLRGEESDRDETFTKNLAAELGLPFGSARADVATAARAGGLNIEDCARRLRIAYLKEEAERVGAARIALGHTADDLAETLIMKLFRGSGRVGLTAIAPVRGMFIRPLIRLRKEELLAYSRQRGIGWVEDTTNADLGRTRNAIRHRIMPVLQTLFPGGAERAGRAADVLREEESYLADAAREALGRCRRPTPPGSVLIERRGFLACHPAIRSRVLRLAAREVGGATDHRNTRQLRSWVEEAAASRRRFPKCIGAGIRVAGRAGFFELIDLERCAPVEAAELRAPGRVEFESLEIAFEARIISRADNVAIGAIDDRAACRLDAEAAGLTLVIRPRRPGDSYRPFGARHPRKIKKMLLDRKLPLSLRRCLPVICSQGRICWVPGLPVGDEFKVGDRTERIIEIRRLSDW